MNKEQKVFGYPTKITIAQHIVEQNVDFTNSESVMKHIIEKPLVLKLEIPWENHNTTDVINAVEAACRKLIKAFQCFD